MEIPHNLIKFINAKSVEDDLLFAAEDLLKKRRGDYYSKGSRPLPDMMCMLRDRDCLKTMSNLSPKLKEYIDKTYPNTYFHAFDVAGILYKKATCFKLNPSSLEMEGGHLNICDKNQGWFIDFNNSDLYHKAKEALRGEGGCLYIRNWDNVWVVLPYDMGIITNPTYITVTEGEIEFYDKHGMFYYISKIAEYLQNNPNILKGLE